MGVFGEGAEGVGEKFAGGRFQDELPSKPTGAALVEGRGGRGNFEIFDGLEFDIGGLDLFQGGFFGFIGDGEAGEVDERRKVGFLTVFG